MAAEGELLGRNRVRKGLRALQAQHSIPDGKYSGLVQCDVD